MFFIPFEDVKHYSKYLEKNFTNWTSGNGRIDDFIQEMQSNISDYYDVIFEWVPYNQFNEIKETGKINSITIYIQQYGRMVHYIGMNRARNIQEIQIKKLF